MSVRTIPTLEEIAAGAPNCTYAQADAELAAVLIVQRRRLDALEEQARPFQEDGHLAVESSPDWKAMYYTMADAHAEKKARAEQAERERDEWKSAWQNSPLEGERDAAVARAERLREKLVKYGSHRPICEASRRTITGCCTCGLTAALEDA